MTVRASNSVALPDAAIKALVAERAKFHRFLARRVGSDADADDLLQTSLLRALRRGDGLRRGERVVPWFYRILRNAVADHFRDAQKSRRKIERLTNELSANETSSSRDGDLDEAVCSCFVGLLPSLKLRYAEIIRRVDLKGELKLAVARDLKLSRRGFDVTLHRARQALRRRLEVFCGACSREHCLTCTCPPSGRSLLEEKV